MHGCVKAMPVHMQVWNQVYFARKYLENRDIDDKLWEKNVCCLSVILDGQFVRLAGNPCPPADPGLDAVTCSVPLVKPRRPGDALL